MDTSTLRDVYRFWFGEAKSPDDVSPERIRYWMEQSDDTDREIRETFGHLIAEAAEQTWDLDCLSREEGVALVVLLDQFPRNIYRTSGAAFAYDHIARDLARRLAAGGIERFTKMERLILACPFAHHEDAADQDYCVMIAAVETVKAPEATREVHRVALDFASKHRDLIRRFGRFPHRNAMLNRLSTPDEVAFLKEHGRGY